VSDKPVLKAWLIGYTDWEFSILFHGETRGKAIARAVRCWPEYYFEFTDARAIRCPKLDGRAFSPENVREAGVYSSDDETEAEIDYWNECDCELCRVEKSYKAEVVEK
jgi:hypothetical protein